MLVRVPGQPSGRGQSYLAPVLPGWRPQPTPPLQILNAIREAQPVPPRRGSPALYLSKLLHPNQSEEERGDGGVEGGQVWILNSTQRGSRPGHHAPGLPWLAGRPQSPGMLRPCLGGRLGLAPMAWKVSSACREPPSLLRVPLYWPWTFLLAQGRHSLGKPSPRAACAPVLLPSSSATSFLPDV